MLRYFYGRMSTGVVSVFLFGEYPMPMPEEDNK